MAAITSSIPEPTGIESSTPYLAEVIPIRPNNLLTARMAGERAINQVFGSFSVRDLAHEAFYFGLGTGLDVMRATNKVANYIGGITTKIL